MQIPPDDVEDIIEAVYDAQEMLLETLSINKVPVLVGIQALINVLVPTVIDNIPLSEHPKLLFLLRKKYEQVLEESIDDED